MLFKRVSFLLAITGVVFLGPTLAAACSSCGCSFNSDWASQGYTNSQGFRFDARFDYIDQNKLVYGSHQVPTRDFVLPNEQEVQRKTISRQTMLGMDYSPSRFWGLHVTLPYLDRTHSTIAPGDTDVSHSGTAGVGDANIVARYQGFSPLANLGIQFGAKFATGTFTDTFNSGPQAGERLDRGLQNGTGTTDALLGLYYFGVLAPGVEYFAQTLGNQPLNKRESFRMGTSVNTSTGVSYQLTSTIKPQLQINYRFEARESGENSDRPNSGSNIIGLTPGVNILLAGNLNLYTLLQIPVYEQVNGYQLEPKVISSVGARYTF